MNFCLKGHNFSRRITGICFTEEKKAIITVIDDLTKNIGYIEITEDDLNTEHFLLTDNLLDGVCGLKWKTKFMIIKIIKTIYFGNVLLSLIFSDEIVKLYETVY